MVSVHASKREAKSNLGRPKVACSFLHQSCFRMNYVKIFCPRVGHGDLPGPGTPILANSNLLTCVFLVDDLFSGCKRQTVPDRGVLWGFQTFFGGFISNSDVPSPEFPNFQVGFSEISAGVPKRGRSKGRRLQKTANVRKERKRAQTQVRKRVQESAST